MTDSSSDVDNPVAELNDSQGLERAYNATSKIFRNRDTLYIAGTSSLGDVMEWPDIPLHKVPQTTRYKTARRYLDSIEGKGIPRLVGHSLGGSVGLELSKDFNIPATTYGAPVVDLIPRNPFHRPHRYACKFDPVAITDFGAKKIPCSDRLNPHSYSGLDKFRKYNYFNII
jgi:hypothetical protein